LEADHLGLIYMAKAGYDPRAARDLWLRMEQGARDRGPAEFLSTHPSHGTRLRQIEQWLPEAMEYYRTSQGGS
jgi:predicted Zn-dependent protease